MTCAAFLKYGGPRTERASAGLKYIYVAILRGTKYVL